MFLLDTNVISEMRKVKTDKIDRNVARWSDGVAADELYLSTITVFELELGMLMVERRDVRQGDMLRTWIRNFVLVAFQTRILPLTTDIALLCAGLNVPDRTSTNDSIIAATARSHGLTVVTRNVADFAKAGVPIINPWVA